MSNSSIFLDDIILSFAEQSPEKIAIQHNHTDISYAELQQRVFALSRRLLEEGVEQGDFVVVFLDPCVDIISTLLAITKIGAIYTPLDPSHPEAQVASKYKNINAKYTVTQSIHYPKAETWAPVTINIDDIDDSLSIPIDFPKRNLAQPGCIFFTSGTTGEPKGVLGSLKALRNAITEPANYLKFTSSDTLNSIARYSWSISMLELLAPLVSGGTTLILDREKALDLEWLKTQVEKCTAFHCPPALLRNFANYIDQTYPKSDIFNHIRLTWYGGDTFSPSHINTLQTVFPNATIGTAYGCTEIFGLSHIYLYPKGKIDKVLIGKPVPGIDHILVTQSDQIVKTGETGEVLLGGDRVAMEYWQSPELNKSKFTTIDGKRYFKTGDQIKRHPEDNLEFLQRQDNQVKIRGIRIELGEIENALCASNKVKEAIVLAVENQNEDRELRAYVVPSQKRANIDDLKHHIRESLPDYMMPAKWFLLDTLPVTENFKVDRNALLELKPKELEPTSLVGLHQEVSAIWTSLTHTPVQASTDNFFETGGNSLLATQLAVLLSKTFEAKIDVADIYRNPAIDAQVALLKTKIEAKTADKQTLRPTQIYATQGQTGLFFREMLNKSGKSITCARYIHSKTKFDVSKVKHAFAHLLERYPTLKTNIKLSRPNLELIENHYTAQDIDCQIIDGEWSLIEGAHNQLLKQDYKFNLSNQPLISAQIANLDDNSQILQVTGHHIACDDTSLGRVAKDFVVIYDGLLNTNATPKIISADENYADFAIEQHKKIHNGYFDNEANSIAEKLLANLETSLKHPVLNVTKGETSKAINFTQKLSGSLKTHSFSQYIAALSWACNKITGRTSFVFCAHSALKRDSDETPIVGMYVNLIPIFTGVNPNHTMQEHSERSLRDLEQAMKGSDTPYELILNTKPELKKLRKYPFDAYINELAFTETLPSGYSNIVVPENLATNTNEMNVTFVESFEGSFLQIESPNAEGIYDIHDNTFTEIDHFLNHR